MNGIIIMNRETLLTNWNKFVTLIRTELLNSRRNLGPWFMALCLPTCRALSGTRGYGWVRKKCTFQHRLGCKNTESAGYYPLVN